MNIAGEVFTNMRIIFIALNIFFAFDDYKQHWGTYDVMQTCQPSFVGVPLQRSASTPGGLVDPTTARMRHPRDCFAEDCLSRNGMQQTFFEYLVISCSSVAN